MSDHRTTEARPAEVTDASRQLASALQHLYHQLMRRSERLRHLDPLPLTLMAKLALSAIADLEPVRIKVLAAALNTTEATASRTVDALVELGLVARGSSPTDGRGVTVFLTEQGLVRVRERRGIFAAQVAEVFDDVSQEDQALVAEVLGRVVAHLVDEEDRDDEAAP